MAENFLNDDVLDVHITSSPENRVLHVSCNTFAGAQALAADFDVDAKIEDLASVMQKELLWAAASFFDGNADSDAVKLENISALKSLKVIVAKRRRKALYVFGGRDTNGPTDRTEMLDVLHGEWMPGPSMPTKRAGCAAAMLPDGRILVVGGFNHCGMEETFLASCDIYDPCRRCWERDGAAPLTRARFGHGCAALGGKVFVVGGCSQGPEREPSDSNSCEVFDPEHNYWSDTAPLNIPRSGARLVAVDDNHLATIGGFCSSFRNQFLNQVEVFDIRTNHWSVLGMLSSPAASPACLTIESQQVLVIGGEPHRSSARIYEVVAGAFDVHSGDACTVTLNSQSLPDTPQGCVGWMAALLYLPSTQDHKAKSARKSVVLIGGESTDGTNWHTAVHVTVFDVSEGKWRSDSPVPPMQVPRTAVALCVAPSH